MSTKCLLFLFLVAPFVVAQSQPEIEAQVRAAHQELLTENGTSNALEAIWNRNRPSEKFLLREFLLSQLRASLAAEKYNGIGQTASFLVRKIYEPGDSELSEILAEVLEAPIGREVVPIVYELELALTSKKNGSGPYGEIANEADTSLVASLKRQQHIVVMNNYIHHFNQDTSHYTEPYKYTVAQHIKDALSHWDADVRIAGLTLTLHLLRNAIEGILDTELLGLCYISAEDQREQRLRTSISNFVDDTPPFLTDHTLTRRQYYIQLVSETTLSLLGNDSKKKISSQDQMTNIASALSMRAPVVDQEYVEKVLDMIEAAKVRGLDLDAYMEHIQYFTELAGKLLRTDLVTKSEKLFPGKFECASVVVH